MKRILMSTCVVLMGFVPAQTLGEVYSFPRSWQDHRPIHLRFVEGQTYSHPAPLFPVTPPEQFEIVEEHVYRAKTMQYEPRVLVKPYQSRQEVSNADPESAVISFYSAMVNQDYDWFMASWDRVSRENILQQDRERKKTPADWKNGWEEFFTIRNIYLISRVESGPYVFIGVQVLKKDGSESGVTDSGFLQEWPGVARKEAGKWVHTNSHVEDPVFSYWSTGRKKKIFSRIIR